MIVDIVNDIITEIKAEYPSYTVLQEFPERTPNFPCVLVDEQSNIVNQNTLDSGGYHHSNITIKVEVITKGTGKITSAKKIRKEIDDILAGKYLMERFGSNRVPNFTDTSLYVLRSTYRGIVDKNKRIYGGN